MKRHRTNPYSLFVKVEDNWLAWHAARLLLIGKQEVN
jgi:hypothetical protein